MLKILLLVALIKLLLTTRKPFLCAGIYTGLWLVLSLIAGTPLLNLLLVGAIGFGLASLYFWMLERLEGTLWYWVTMIAGLGIGLV